MKSPERPRPVVVAWQLLAQRMTWSVARNPPRELGILMINRGGVDLPIQRKQWAAISHHDFAAKLWPSCRRES